MAIHDNIDHSGLLGVASFGSNSNAVSQANAPGASGSNSRADHVHMGVQSIAHSSNTFAGPIILTASGVLGITSPTPGTINLSSVDVGGGGSGSVATDAIWDAAGDLAVGSGANTAAKLTKGSDGEVLTMVAGAVDWATPASGGGFVPYTFDPFVKSDHDIGWGTYVAAGSGSGNLLPYLQSSGSQNAEIVFDAVTLGAGTYTVEVVVFQATNHGIIHVQIGGTDLTTFDTYAGSITTDQRMTATGLSVGSGALTISMQMSTKNGSSSSYYGLVNRLVFTRTA